MTARPEPRFPDDGICANDGCTKKHARLDAFCSNTCARAYFGAPIASESIWAQNYGQAEPERPGRTGRPKGTAKRR